MNTTLVNEAGVGTNPSTKKFFPVVRNETGCVSLQLATGLSASAAGGTLAGSWKVYGSNAPGADVNGDPFATDITASWTQPGSSNAIAAVTTGGSSQGVQAGNMWFKYIAAVFTPTNGAGQIVAYMNVMEKT